MGGDRIETWKTENKPNGLGSRSLTQVTTVRAESLSISSHLRSSPGCGSGVT